MIRLRTCFRSNFQFANNDGFSARNRSQKILHAASLSRVVCFSRKQQSSSWATFKTALRCAVVQIRSRPVWACFAAASLPSICSCRCALLAPFGRFAPGPSRIAGAPSSSPCPMSRLPLALPLMRKMSFARFTYTSATKKSETLSFVDQKPHAPFVQWRWVR